MKLPLLHIFGFLMTLGFLGVLAMFFKIIWTLPEIDLLDWQITVTSAACYFLFREAYKFQRDK